MRRQAVGLLAVALLAGGSFYGRAATTTRPPHRSLAAPTVHPNAPTTGDTTTTAPRRPLYPARDRVSVYGDSLVTQSEPYLSTVGGWWGLTVTAQAFFGTAPCDYLPALQRDLAAKKVDVVVWAFSGNSIGACMLGPNERPLTGAAWLAKYRTDTKAAIAAALAANVPFVLASPPAARNAGDWPALDAVYRQVAAGQPEVRYDDVGVAIAPGGRFEATQPCLSLEALIPQAESECLSGGGAISVRGPDGVHFCAPSPAFVCSSYASGAMRYAINLLSAARLDHIGTAPAAAATANRGAAT